MKRYKLSLIFLHIFVINSQCQQYFNDDIINLYSQKSPNTTVIQSNNSYPKHSKDIDIIATVVFRLYKSLISSQDNRSCIFEPSCSEYAISVLTHHNVIVGWVLTFDRLSRCHGLVKFGHYEYDKNLNLFYDYPD